MTAYLTDAKELTAIADAIREKTGLTDSLSYPLDFIRAVEEYAPPPDRIFGTALTGDVVWTGQTVRGNVSGSGVTSFYAPNAVDVPTAYSNGSGKSRQDMHQQYFSFLFSLDCYKQPSLQLTK